MANNFRAIGATTFLAPIPAVMLSCRGTEPGFDRDNLITVAWAGVVNSDPPMVSVSIRPSRHSYAQILQSGAFCLNLIDQPLCRAADFCGVKSACMPAKSRVFPRRRWMKPPRFSVAG